jgi:hypothetical protein
MDKRAPLDGSIEVDHLPPLDEGRRKAGRCIAALDQTRDHHRAARRFYTEGEPLAIEQTGQIA